MAELSNAELAKEIRRRGETASWDGDKEITVPLQWISFIAAALEANNWRAFEIEKDTIARYVNAEELVGCQRTGSEGNWTMLVRMR